MMYQVGGLWMLASLVRIILSNGLLAFDKYSHERP